jgi:phytoene desaturase
MGFSHASAAPGLTRIMGVLQSVNFRHKRRPGAGISSQSQRIIVVGAGPGGLAAAAILAKAGLDVTVIERREHSGGRTATFSEAGFKFDIGPTFFHYPQVLEGIFASLGFDLWKEVDLRRLDPQYRLVFGAGGNLLATPVVEKMRAEIANLSPRDAEYFETFLRDNRRKLTRFRPFLEKSSGSWRDAVSRDILQLLPLIRPWKSLDAELRRYFSDERIRLAFSFQSKYLGMSPFQCPSLFSIFHSWNTSSGCFIRLADAAL